MAKVRYLINNDPYASMQTAVKSENIMNARFYNRFVELWGRMSTGSYGETFDLSSAVHDVDGIDVYGNERVYLFQDGAEDYAFTKRFCELIGADYDELYDHLGDVDKFYVELNGNVSVDFSETSNVISAMTGMETDLDALGIDRIVLTWILDTEYDEAATAGMTLSELRTASTAHINYNTGDFLEDAETLGLKPVMECYGQPTETSPDGDPVTITDEALTQIMTLFLQFTDALDDVFNSVSVSDTTLADRGAYHRYEYSVAFSFDSTVETNLIDWSPITTNAFAEDFVDHYDAGKAFAEEHQFCYGGTVLGGQSYCYFDENPSSEIASYTSIIMFLNEYAAPAELFYLPLGTLSYFMKHSKAYMRYDELMTMRKRDINMALMLAMKIGAKEEDDGWLGGSWFGKLLEAVFTIAVVIVSVVASVIVGNPYPLIIGATVLYAAAKYTGMSISGVRFASFGIRFLSVAAIAYGIYDIYTNTYNLAVDEAVTEAMVDVLAGGGTDIEAFVAGETAASGITAVDVLSSLGITDTMKLIGKFQSAFNLLSPPEKPEASEDVQEVPEPDTSIYNIQSSYDLYDDVYNIY
jgi:hypothetical protein